MIVEKLYAGEHQVRQGPQHGVLRMSMVEMCTRRAAYDYLGYPEEPGDNDDLSEVKMQDGNLHESDIVRRLLAKGFEIWNWGEGQTWVTVKHNGLFFRGHPDLFIKIDGKIYGLDVKGFRDEVFKKHTSNAVEVEPGLFVITDYMSMAEGPFPVMGQMQLYLHSEKAKQMGITEWIVLMKNKNTAELAECFIPRMPDYLDNVTKRWKGFWGYVEAQRLPDRNFEKESLQCKMCPHRQKCWGILGNLRNRKVEVTNPKTLEMADLWREGKDFEKKASVRLELSRLSFEKAAIAENANEVWVDDLKITVTPRERTSLDSGYVGMLLDDLWKEGKITREQLNQCWNTSEYYEVRVVDTRRKGSNNEAGKVPK